MFVFTFKHKSIKRAAIHEFIGTWLRFEELYTGVILLGNPIPVEG